MSMGFDANRRSSTDRGAMLSPRALEDMRITKGDSRDATPREERLTFARNEEVKFND